MNIFGRWWFLLSLLLVFVSIVALSSRVHAFAVPPTPIGGYAWSSNIGWISLNCEEGGPGQSNVCGTSNYDVISSGFPTGTLSGYAWSSNIGWVSFNYNDVQGCPVPQGSSCQGKVARDGTVTGWARAISAIGRTDGWDGWIDLGSTGYGDGLTAQDGVLSGFAWGGNVVGWVSFSGVYATPNTHICIDSNNSQTTDTQGNTTTTDCPLGCNQGTGECITGCTCSPDGSSECTTDPNQVAVTACNDGCNQSTGQCIPPSASGCLSTKQSSCVESALVTAQSKVNLYGVNLSNVNLSSCSISATNADRGTLSGNSEFTTKPITQKAIYTLTCTDSNGAPYTSSVSITLIPSYREL